MSEETPDSRIRILIMGTAGVGKTTILQKICSETDTPIVRNPEGEVISSPDSLVPTTARGLHDINLEITYPSRPGFVFHDSRGIECGSANELNEMREFLIQRAKNATNAIHVIWYCISANSDRPLVPAERQFFERDMGKVPVVVIFTKLDGLETKAYNHLKAEGLTRNAAFQGREARANEMLQEHFVRRIMELAHPLMGFVSFKGLHKPGQHCAELTRKTVEALKHNQDLQARFVLASRYDLKARLMALGGWIRKQEMSMTDEALTRGVLLYFPHVWRRIYGFDHIFGDGDLLIPGDDGGFFGGGSVLAAITSSITVAVLPNVPASNQDPKLCIFAGTCIVADICFWNPRHQAEEDISDTERLLEIQHALEIYQQEKKEAVIQGISQILAQLPSGEVLEALSRLVLQHAQSESAAKPRAL